LNKIFSFLFLMLFACESYANSIIVGNLGSKIRGEVVSTFSYPWSFSFLNNDHLLVATKPGKIWLMDSSGSKIEVENMVSVEYGGQGGMGDVVPHPNYSENNNIYFSYITSDDGGKTRYAVVDRAILRDLSSPKLESRERIWEQFPAVIGKGHFSHRIAFGPKGSVQENKIFITSGDRQMQDPAQMWDTNFGKIVRLNDDGSVPQDNPFKNRGELAKTFWTTGHRNALGLAFDQKNQLWANEMGPRHGDELNLIVPGSNYGWPLVSEGNHYNGAVIPPHDTRPEFTSPVAYWVPTLAPSGLTFYSGNEFKEWQGQAFLGGLKGKSLVRLKFKDERVIEEERFSWRVRVRDVEVQNSGSVWVIEDGSNARLIKFSSPN
jgi:glucose/arabinose dehydrogenase